MKLIEREPTPEMIEAMRDNGATFTGMFKATYDAAPEIQQEPAAIVDANDDGYWADILPDRSVKVGQPLYAFPPDAQAEIAKRDERIKELEEREQILVRANSSANILNNELAAQNQQLREALNEAGRLYCTMIGNDLMHNPSMFARNTVCTYVRSWFRKCKPKVIESALSLHDLASPVLNRVKAEALRDAADEFDAQREWKGHGQQLRNMADAIEKGE